MMRGLRLLPLFAFIAACAEISGLHDLTTNDGGSGATDAASETIVPDDSSVDVQVVETGGGGGDAATPFCLGLVSSSYAFCADFDEGSATMGFAKGAPAPWPSISASMPTLTMVTPHSPPAAGSFNGTSHQLLSYAAGTTTTTVTLSAQIRVDKLADQTSMIVVVQTTASSAISLALTRSTSDTTQFMAQLDSLTLGADGGPSTSSPHAFLSSYAVGVWHPFTLTINAQVTAGTLDNTDVVSFATPAQNDVPNIAVAIGYTQTGWTGSFDDVYFKLK